MRARILYPTACFYVICTITCLTGVFLPFPRITVLGVSDKVSSYSEGFKRWLPDYEEKEIIMPRKGEWVPRQEFLGWHRGNVFIR